MKGKKKILLAVVLVLVMAVGITSIVVIRNRNKTVVKVFPVSMLNSSDWFDTDTSLTGTLTSDYIQEVHIDGGQKVKKVYVKKGDKVKKGDILLKYNVSEKELDLKLQKLQIQSSKMEIAEMEKELKKLKNTKTVGAVNTGNSDVMNASVNLSAIKGTSLSYLVAEADKNEGTTADSGVKTQSSDTSSEATTAKKDETGTTAKKDDETGTTAKKDDETGTTAKKDDETGTTAKKEDETGTTAGKKDDTTSEPKENINSLSDASGSGTKDDKYIFNLKKDGKISGSVIKQLKDKGESGYAVFIEHNGDDTSTYTLTPEKLSNINVKESKMYSVEELKSGGDENIVDDIQLLADIKNLSFNKVVISLLGFSLQNLDENDKKELEKIKK